MGSLIIIVRSIYLRNRITLGVHEFRTVDRRRRRRTKERRRSHNSDFRVTVLREYFFRKNHTDNKRVTTSLNLKNRPFTKKRSKVSYSKKRK